MKFMNTLFIQLFNSFWSNLIKKQDNQNYIQVGRNLVGIFIKNLNIKVLKFEGQSLELSPKVLFPWTRTKVTCLSRQTFKCGRFTQLWPSPDHRRVAATVVWVMSLNLGLGLIPISQIHKSHRCWQVKVQRRRPKEFVPDTLNP